MSVCSDLPFTSSLVLLLALSFVHKIRSRLFWLAMACTCQRFLSMWRICLLSTVAEFVFTHCFSAPFPYRFEFFKRHGNKKWWFRVFLVINRCNPTRRIVYLVYVRSACIAILVCQRNMPKASKGGSTCKWLGDFHWQQHAVSTRISCVGVWI